MIVLVFAGLLQADPLPSPPSLSGRVVDDSTGRPLRGAHISLLEDNRLTTSDENGEFFFFHLSPGFHKLRVSYLGYRTGIRELTVREGMTTRVLLALNPLVLSRDTVTVSYPRESDSGTFIIDEAAIRRSGWSDAGDALRAVPGAQVFESGGPGGRKTVSLRGCRPDHVTVLLDGVALNDGSGEAVDLSTLPLDGVWRIVITPDYSPETGTSMPGGTISIITAFQGSEALFSLNADSKYASFSTESYGLTGEGSIFGLSVRGSGKLLTSAGDFSYTDEYGAKGRRYNNGVQRGNGVISLEKENAAEWRLSSAVSWDEAFRGSPSPLYQAPTPDAWQRDTNLRFRGNASRTFHGGALSIRGFFTNRSRRFVSPRLQTDPETGVEIRHAPVDISDHDLRSGLNLRFAAPPILNAGRGKTGGIELGSVLERFRSENGIEEGDIPDPIVGGVFRFNAFASGFSEAGARWRSLLWNLQGKIRLDALHDSDNGLSLPLNGETVHPTGQGRLTISPAVNETHLRWNIYLSGGNSFAAPSFVSAFLVESVFSLGNPDLLPERGVGITIGGGFRHRMDTKRFGLDLAAYRRIINDRIIWRRNYRGQYQPVNLGRSRGEGVEMTLSGSLFRQLLDVRGSLTMQRVVDDDPQSPFYGRRIPFQPDLYGSVVCSINGKGFALNGELRFSGRRYTSFSNQDYLSTAGGGLEPFAVLDLTLLSEYRIGRWKSRISLGVDNVLDERYELLDRMPMPGRSWWLGVRIRYARDTVTFRNTSQSEIRMEND